MAKVTRCGSEMEAACTSKLQGKDWCVLVEIIFMRLCTVFVSQFCCPEAFHCWTVVQSC